MPAPKRQAQSRNAGDFRVDAIHAVRERPQSKSSHRSRLARSSAAAFNLARDARFEVKDAGLNGDSPGAKPAKGVRTPTPLGHCSRGCSSELGRRLRCAQASPSAWHAVLTMYSVASNAPCIDVSARSSRTGKPLLSSSTSISERSGSFGSIKCCSRTGTSVPAASKSGASTLTL